MTTPERSLEIANTILSHLGGSLFVRMTGAKNLLRHESGLSFRLPGGGGFTKEGINYVKVTLTPADLYTVEFGKVRKSKGVPTYKVLSVCEEIYNENLRETFTAYTGLETRF